MRLILPSVRILLPDKSLLSLLTLRHYFKSQTQIDLERKMFTPLFKQRLWTWLEACSKKEGRVVSFLRFLFLLLVSLPHLHRCRAPPTLTASASRVCYTEEEGTAKVSLKVVLVWSGFVFSEAVRMLKVVVISLGCFGTLCSSLALGTAVDASILGSDLQVFLQPWASSHGAPASSAGAPLPSSAFLPPDWEGPMMSPRCFLQCCPHLLHGNIHILHGPEHIWKLRMTFWSPLSLICSGKWPSIRAAPCKDISPEYSPSQLTLNSRIC